MLRMPVVAGRFYPGEKGALENDLENYLDDGLEKEPFAGALVPHAGYVYSGKTAGEVYSRVSLPPVVVVIGPNHTGRGLPGAVACEGGWKTPLGEVPVNSELAGKIVESSEFLAEDYLAHEHEHSIEVQIPFLQTLRKDIQIVPVALADCSLEFCREAGIAVHRAVRAEGAELSIIASSDMSHYEPEDSARKKDALAIEAICALDDEKLLYEVTRNNISMCGCAPAMAMIAACRAAGAQKARLVSYSTSADASGDRSSVVGYAGIIIK